MTKIEDGYYTAAPASLTIERLNGRQWENMALFSSRAHCEARFHQIVAATPSLSFRVIGRRNGGSKVVAQHN